MLAVEQLTGDNLAVYVNEKLRISCSDCPIEKFCRSKLPKPQTLAGKRVASEKIVQLGADGLAKMCSATIPRGLLADSLAIALKVVRKNSSIVLPDIPEYIEHLDGQLDAVQALLQCRKDNKPNCRGPMLEEFNPQHPQLNSRAYNIICGSDVIGEAFRQYQETSRGIPLNPEVGAFVAMFRFAEPKCV